MPAERAYTATPDDYSNSAYSLASSLRQEISALFNKALDLKSYVDLTKISIDQINNDAASDKAVVLASTSTATSASETATARAVQTAADAAATAADRIAAHADRLSVDATSSSAATSATSASASASAAGTAATAATAAAASVSRGQPNGVAALDSGGRAPLAQLQIRTAQVIRAARSVLVANGGSVSGFLAAQGGPDATDGSWEAIFVEAFAPTGGILYTALGAYLQSLGLSSGAATTALTSIWTAAPSLTP